MSKQRFVQTSDGTRIAVYDEGNASGPTLVLVHGHPGTHAVWDPVVALLADRFRVVRYDTRGAGESSVPKPVSAYSMERYADDFAAVLDAEGSPSLLFHTTSRSTKFAELTLDGRCTLTFLNPAALTCITMIGTAERRPPVLKCLARPASAR